MTHPETPADGGTMSAEELRRTVSYRTTDAALWPSILQTLLEDDGPDPVDFREAAWLLLPRMREDLTDLAALAGEMQATAQEPPAPAPRKPTADELLQTLDTMRERVLHAYGDDAPNPRDEAVRLCALDEAVLPSTATSYGRAPAELDPPCPDQARPPLRMIDVADRCDWIATRLRVVELAVAGAATDLLSNPEDALHVAIRHVHEAVEELRAAAQA